MRDFCQVRGPKTQVNGRPSGSLVQDAKGLLAGARAYIARLRADPRPYQAGAAQADPLEER